MGSKATSSYESAIAGYMNVLSMFINSDISVLISAYGSSYDNYLYVVIWASFLHYNNYHILILGLITIQLHLFCGKMVQGHFSLSLSKLSSPIEIYRGRCLEFICNNTAGASCYISAALLLL